MLYFKKVSLYIRPFSCSRHVFKYKFSNVWVISPFISHYQIDLFFVLFQFHHFLNITSSCFMTVFKVSRLHVTVRVIVLFFICVLDRCNVFFPKYGSILLFRLFVLMFNAGSRFVQFIWYSIFMLLINIFCIFVFCTFPDWWYVI